MLNKSSLIGAVAGAITVTTVVAVAGYQFAKAPAYAEVISVRPVTTAVSTPREECDNVAVTRPAPTKDPHQITGTVAGAVVGGVLGHQLGAGDGNKVATVAGAAAGGYAGNKIQERMQEKNTYTTTERQCRTETDTTEKTVGYEVTYRLRGKEGVVRMDHDPGSRIPVRDGELVLSAES